MIIIKIVWRVELSQIEENKPPKMVIIVINDAFKSKVFNSSVINGFHFICIQKQKQFKIKMKKALFWYKVCPDPKFAKEIIRIIAIFLNKKKNSLLSKNCITTKQKLYTNKMYVVHIHSKGIQLYKWHLCGK